MPYINKDRRPELDKVAENVIDVLKNMNYNGGDLNYLISKIIWTLFQDNKRYANAAELIATLECVKLELYRRKIGPYEDIKITDNGDVQT